MTTQAELATQLQQLTEQTNKVKTEVQKVLEAVGNQENVSPELQAAADGLKAAIQGVDDLNADAATGGEPTSENGQ